MKWGQITEEQKRKRWGTGKPQWEAERYREKEEEQRGRQSTWWGHMNQLSKRVIKEAKCNDK